MNALEMLLRCRAGQRAMGDDAPEGDLPSGAPVEGAGFTDDHGVLVAYVPPAEEQVPEGP